MGKYPNMSDVMKNVKSFDGSNVLIRLTSLAFKLRLTGRYEDALGLELLVECLNDPRGLCDSIYLVNRGWTFKFQNKLAIFAILASLSNIGTV
jgi:hypothetical protein